MTEYVLGFMFDNDYGIRNDAVVLIRKNRPEWQAGKLNGVGGKVEKDELPIDAMTREFREETGMFSYNWKHFATMNGNDSRVYVYYGYGNIYKVRSMTDEVVGLYSASEVVNDKSCVDNIRWLLPMIEAFKRQDQKYDFLEINYIRDVKTLTNELDVTIPDVT